jgi:hypothetical protein
MSLALVLVSILAVWRATHFLHAEDGPWKLAVKLRNTLREARFGGPFECFYCLSLWVSAPVSALLANGWSDGMLLWLGLSGGAIVIERVLPAEARYFEDAEAPDEERRP